jgi:hypothetical protein
VKASSPLHFIAAALYVTDTGTYVNRSVTTISRRSPDAVQRETVHRRSGVFAISAFAELAMIPGLQRTTPLRYVLRCAREMFSSSLVVTKEGTGPQFIGWASVAEPTRQSMTDDDVGTARRAFAHPTLTDLSPRLPVRRGALTAAKPHRVRGSAQSYFTPLAACSIRAATALGLET